MSAEPHEDCVPKLKTMAPRLRPLNPRLKVLNPNSWRADKTSTQRGYGYRWQQYRKAYLARHPLCVMCQAKGCTVEATVVDHITPHRGDERLFWDEANHQALCAPCHSSEKQREEQGQ